MKSTLPYLITLLLAIAILLGALILRDGLLAIATELQELRNQPWPPLSEQVTVETVSIEHLLFTSPEEGMKDSLNLHITGPFHIQLGQENLLEGELSGEVDTPLKED